MTFTPWLAALVLSSFQPNGLPLHAMDRLGASPQRLGPVHVAVSADGQRIITVTTDGYSCIFSAATGEPLSARRLVERNDRNLYGGGGSGSLAGLSADGSLALIFDGEDYSARSIRIVDTTTGKVKMKYPSQNGGNNWISAAVMSRDGKKILVNEYGNGNPRHVIVDVETGASKMFLEQANGGFISGIGFMQFSPDGKQVLILDINNAAPGNQMTGTCYNAEDGKKLWSEPVGMSPCYTLDSKNLIVESKKNSPRARNAATGKEVKLNLPPEKEIRQVAIVGPKNQAMFPQPAGGVMVWNLQSGAKINTLPTGPFSSTSYANPLQSASAFAPDGSFVVTAFNGHLCRWNLPDGKKVFGDPTPPGSATPVNRLVFSPDGKKIFSLGQSDMPGVWDVATKSWVRTPLVDQKPAKTDDDQDVMNLNFFYATGSTQSAAFSAAGPRYLVGGYNKPMEVRDGTTGKVISKLKEGLKSDENDTQYHFGQLSADGTTATIYRMSYTGNQSKMNFETWDVNTTTKSNSTEFTFPNYASIATLSPCGRFGMIGGNIVVLSSGSTLFSIVKNQQQQYYYYGGMTTFSDDGRLLATTQNEESLRGNITSPGTVYIWDAVTGTNIRKLSTGSNSNAIAFSPDNRLIAFANIRGVKIYDLNSSKLLVTFAATDLQIPNYYGGFGVPSPLAFSPDGRTLATGHLDGTITLWKVPPPPELPPVNPNEFDKFWESLTKETAADARTNLYRLLQSPNTALQLFNQKFIAPPQKPLDIDLPSVIRRLDAPAFSDRQNAIRKLKELGPRIAPALLEAIRTTESVEIRARAEEMLDQMKAGPRIYPGGPDLRAVRSIEVLERIGTPEACKILQGWANNTTNMRIANEAALALTRITARTR